eukprot:97928_1
MFHPISPLYHILPIILHDYNIQMKTLIPNPNVSKIICNHYIINKSHQFNKYTNYNNTLMYSNKNTIIIANCINIQICIITLSPKITKTHISSSHNHIQI